MFQFVRGVRILTADITEAPRLLGTSIGRKIVATGHCSVEVRVELREVGVCFDADADADVEVLDGVVFWPFA